MITQCMRQSLLPIIVVVIGLVPKASAFIMQPSNPEHCRELSKRQTLVYIDKAVLIRDDTEWMNPLLGKMIDTLMPSEPVYIIELSSDEGSAREIWYGCYPKVIREAGGFGGKALSLALPGPKKRLEEQQERFSEEVDKALKVIYDAGARKAGEVQFMPDDAPNRSVMDALRGDEARLLTRNLITRVIIYTDGFENPEVLNVFANNKDDANMVSAIGARELNFGNGIFYLYGIASTASGSTKMVANGRALWHVWLTEANAHLAHFGPGLVMPASKPVSGDSCDMHIDVGGRTLPGRIVMLADAHGNLVESYVVMLGGERSARIAGLWKCETDDSCKLKADVLSPLVTGPISSFRAKQGHEKIQLDGSRESLSGILHMPGTKLSMSFGEHEGGSSNGRSEREALVSPKFQVWASCVN